MLQFSELSSVGIFKERIPSDAEVGGRLRRRVRYHSHPGLPLGWNRHHQRHQRDVRRRHVRARGFS